MPGSGRISKATGSPWPPWRSLFRAGQHPGWTVPVIAGAMVLISPLVALVWLAVTGDTATWPHLIANVLPRAVRTTLFLMAGVGLVTLVIGAGTAWLVTMYAFPGRRVFAWMLAIPLAMPTYLAAFCYLELWDYSGWVQTGLRQAFGWTSARDYWFPEIRSLGGAVLVMSFVLYPYVYMMARASFLQQTASVIEAGRTLGCSPLRAFWSVALPMARPALAAGVALALMECLNDIGAVEHLGVNTLTLSVYTTWLQRGSLPGAAQIAVVMLLFVLGLVLVERWSRRGRVFDPGKSRLHAQRREHLRGWRMVLAFAACLTPILIGFAIPALVLIVATFDHLAELAEPSFWRNALHSFLLAVSAAVAAVLVSLFMVFSVRLTQSKLVAGLIRLSAIGYAVPGTVLAIGVIIVVARLDGALAPLGAGLALGGTSAALVFALVVRFLAVSHGTLDSGMARLSPHLDAVARSLGRTPLGVMREIHVPLLRPAIGAAILLVFVDSMKELPATLLLRPFDFDTLATHVYTLASLDLFETGAPAALTIVLIGILPVILLNRVTARRAILQPRGIRGGLAAIEPL